jgi:hypothetical protein
LGHEHHRDASDEIARGLVAGWDVDADGGKLIRSGSFYGSLLSEAKNVESWLEAALESPFGRYKLLRPDADQLAIGIAPASDVGGMGVILTTYEFFDENSRAADEAAVYKRLGEARASRALPPVTSLPPMPVFDEELRLVRAGKRNPREVTDIVLAHETRRLQRPLVGAFSLTHDLADTTITRYLLGKGPLSVRAAVTIYKPEGSPWGYYAVYIIGSLPDEAAALLGEER